MRNRQTDEVDLALVDAVRVAPRATWQELAPVLDLDPATVSRRWNRLENEGLAWVTAHLAGVATPACAVVELECVPGTAPKIADELASDIEAATIKLTSGARDLVVLAQARDLRELSDYLLVRLGGVAGVTRVRSHLATDSRIDGSRWRDGALDRGQRRKLAGNRPSAARTRQGIQATDYLIARSLGTNGRVTLAHLAEQTGLSRASVRRRLDALIRGGYLTFRCDTSYQLADRRIATVHFATYTADSLTDLETTLGQRPGVRAVSLVAGPSNVVIEGRLRAVAEIQEFESSIRQGLPNLRIDDRSVVFRVVKHLGRVLDEDGRSVRVVPLIAQPEA